MKRRILLITLLALTFNFYGQIPVSVGTPSKKKNKYIVMTDYKPTMDVLDSILEDKSYIEVNNSRIYFVPKKKIKKVSKALSKIEDPIL